ncbi:hypothetical protein [Bifidobacterium tissieri]|uniref:Uncharacterized protein n=2 Tax=Bifidobacterium tissieri TaxID=1630162 RepID=A0A261F869_9BIFI
MIQNIATLLGLIQVVFELIDAIGAGSRPALVAAGALMFILHAIHPLIKRRGRHTRHNRHTNREKGL